MIDYDGLVNCLMQGSALEYAKSSTLNRHARKAHTDFGGDFGCRDCGKVHPSNDIHHRDDDPLNNDPGNLVPLCRSCHTKRHNKQGRG